MEVARHWVRGRLTTEDTQAVDHVQRDAALAAFGLELELATVECPRFGLWPEHALPLALWTAAQTCMRRGLHGAEGLDYAAVHALLVRTQCLRLPRSPRRRAAVWADLRVIELAALAEWHEMRLEQANDAPQR